MYVHGEIIMNKLDVKQEEGIGMKHKYKAILASCGVIFAILATASMFVILISKDEDGSRLEFKGSLDGVEESIDQPTSDLVNQLDNAYYSGDVGSGEVTEIFNQILKNPNTQPSIKQQALDSMSDFCHLSVDIQCLEDLKDQYQAADLDTVFIDSFIKDLEKFPSGFNTEAEALIDAP